MKLFLTTILFLLYISGESQDWSEVNKQSLGFYNKGQYNEAIQTADKALQIAIANYGISSNQYLASLSNKAYAQSARGDYLKALTNFRKATSISFNVYGLPHVEQMQILGELSKTFIAMAAYDSAEHYLNIAKFIYTSVPKENKWHYDTAAFALTDTYLKINSLEASLHYRKGQLKRAIQLLEDQIFLLKELYSTDYEEIRDYQTTINNLSTYYNEALNVDEGKRYALEYYRLIQKKNDQLDLIHALQNLGSVYRNKDQIDSALHYWNEALILVNSGNYKNTHIHTVILNNLGEVSLHTESYDASTGYLKESLAIQQAKESVNPPLYKTTLFNLAESYRWAGDYMKADSIYTDLIQSLLDDIAHNFTYLSDNEKLSFYKNQVSFIDHYKSFALEITGILPLQGVDDPYINPGIAGALYNLQLTTKAIILNASKRMKRNILTSGDSTLIRIYSLWEERKNLLAQALIKEDKSNEELEKLKIKIEENEKWLTANSRSFNSGFKVKKTTWEEVQKQLQPGEAAVEIVRLIDGLIYGALIITPETIRQPILSLVMSTRSKHLDNQFYKNYYNSIVNQLEDTLSYKTYWQPIIDTIKNHMPSQKMPSRVYISNDGIYNQINLNALHNPITKQYVLDETQVVVVTNSKELLSPEKEQREAIQKSAALFGRPLFSTQPGATKRFQDLPGTGKEVRMLSKTLSTAQWGTIVFTGQNATERNLKKLNDISVLHLASHGFFTPELKQQEISLAETMIQSGIALAGVNDTIKSGEDGLLTAFEVINLNLDSTELVVLSACETARGEVNHGEGVYGLQRALRVAGAQNMIMSLWKVDDEATQKLMVGFYNRWIETGDKRMAFIEAQKDLRKEYPNPYYWGAFILAGK